MRITNGSRYSTQQHVVQTVDDPTVDVRTEEINFFRILLEISHVISLGNALWSALTTESR